MAFELSLQINNQSISSHNSVIRITDDNPTLNWDFDLANRASIDSETGIVSDIDEYSQVGYEIRISTSSINVGRDSFIGNRIQTGFVTSQEFFWRYSGIALVRGTRYYGQIYVRDQADRKSEWRTFSFKYNSLPYVGNISFTPVLPSPTDDIQLDYDFYDDDEDTEDGTVIRWFKNGVYQRQFDNATLIKSYFLQNGDMWNADIYPSDGYEYGSRTASSYVKISKTAVTVSNIGILPNHPNPDDILKADYFASNEQEQENVLIRWYVNDVLITEFNDQQYVKPSVEEGDEVRFEVKHEDGSSYVSSTTVTIVASDFIVTNITIDGKSNPLNASSVTPLVRWKSYVPEGKQINYISIKIGTFYEASNVYSSLINYNRDSFTIPANILQRGRDYYISIAVSDTQSFDKYASEHFRINGSRWEEIVSNSTGWTVEMLFFVPAGSSVNTTDYHAMRINDGSKFAEIRLYSNKIRLTSGSRKEYTVDTTIPAVLTVAGQNDDIKIYLNKELIIDGAGIFTQSSNIRRLEVGAYSSITFEIHYKYLSYTTSGYFLPGVSGEYTNLQFYTFMEFEDNEVVALNSYVEGKYVFGLNPDNTNESSTIYAITPGESKKGSTVPRTFAPINKINRSPDKKITVCAHSKGATVITGYLISPFDHELIFVDENNNLYTTLPNESGWELVRNTTFNAAYFNNSGLNIDTIGT